MSRRRKALLLALTAVLALIWNRDFLRPWPLSVMLEMNDVASILAGYYQTPDLLRDGLRWWHGPWIQQEIFAFRPVSAYLYWGECWAGLRWGFGTTAWLGYALFVANCLLGTTLAWRLTRSSWPCTLLAALLLPLARVFNVGQPAIWLAWFPVHQDLLMSALLLAALLCFDGWFAGGGRRLLAGSWAFFALACLSKEHAYIFPLFAGVVAVGRHRTGLGPSLRTGLWQAGAMLLSVGVLWVYRASVLRHPRNPTADGWAQAQALLTYLYGALGRDIFAKAGWVPGLALLLLTLIGLAVKFRRAGYAQTRWGRWAERPMVWLPGLIAVVWAYLTLVQGSAPVGLWFFLDGEVAVRRLTDLATNMVMLYATFLLWKYRRWEDTAAMWGFLALSYAPVLGYFGWHYTLPSWFVRVSYDVLVVKLTWIDWGCPRLPPLSRSHRATEGVAADRFSYL